MNKKVMIAVLAGIVVAAGAAAAFAATPAPAKQDDEIHQITERLTAPTIPHSQAL